MKNLLFAALVALAVLSYFNGKAWWKQLFPKPGNYGLDHNKTRSTRRIMLLPASWKSTDSTAESQTWAAADTLFSSDTGYRKLKSIRLRDGKIVYEEDWVAHFLKDSSFKEYLVFGYFYDSLSPHHVTYSRSGAAAVHLSKADGDSLMRAWGVQRHLQ